MKYLTLLCAVTLCGCHQVATKDAHYAFQIVSPAHVKVDSSRDSLSLSPELRITNLTGGVLGITHWGNQVETPQISYRLVDCYYKEVPLLRRDNTGPGIWTPRGWVTLLHRGEFIEWTPFEALIYRKVRKGRYWLVARVEMQPPADWMESGLSAQERRQIDRNSHTIESAPLEISVE
jgi:hypothetical protein